MLRIFTINVGKRTSKIIRDADLKLTDTQESLVFEAAALEASLVIEGAALEASLVIAGASLEATLDDNLVAKESTYESVTSLEQLDESSSSENDADADIGPSYDSDTISKVHHDIFENMFVHGIQNHEQPESIPDTYVVNENNSNIIYDKPHMDPDRGKEEHDIVDYEQQHALLLP
ncbi:hypothetical protein Tco_1420740 [Tanacetum coccineum]